MAAASRTESVVVEFNSFFVAAKPSLLNSATKINRKLCIQDISYLSYQQHLEAGPWKKSLKSEKSVREDR